MEEDGEYIEGEEGEGGEGEIVVTQQEQAAINRVFLMKLSYLPWVSAKSKQLKPTWPAIKTNSSQPTCSSKDSQTETSNTQAKATTKAMKMMTTSLTDPYTYYSITVNN